MITYYKWLLISCILLINQLGFSQLSFFLPDSNAYFSVSNVKFWFQGDTSINDKLYKKVFYQDHDSLPKFDIAEYYAAVREDTLNERIFTIQKYDGQERLLADFSLNAEDTVTIYTYWPGVRYVAEDYFVTISEKDSIEIGGQFHKRLKIEGPDYDEYWIEGIGSTFGLFFSGADRNVFEINIPILLCVHIEDTLYYDNPEYEGCYIQSPVNIENNENLSDGLLFSINNEIISLHCELPSDNNFFQIIDTNGRIIFMDNFSRYTKINISSLPKGFYVIRVYSASNSLNRIFKFVKY